MNFAKTGDGRSATKIRQSNYEAFPCIFVDDFWMAEIEVTWDVYELFLNRTSDDIKGTLGKLMWANCKACHSKFREAH